MEITNRTLLAYTVAAVSILAAMAYAEYAIPICFLSLKTEATIRMASTIVIFVLIVPVIVYARSRGKEGKKYIPIIFFIFFCSAPLSWITARRAHVVELAHWKFDGSISKKYLSSNHALDSLTIGGVNYEDVPSRIWNLANVGDVITKKPCSNVIQIDGKGIRFGSWNFVHCCPST